MAIDDDLNETLRKLDRTLNNLSASAIKAASNDKSAKHTLDRNASLLSSSFKLLHGHVDDFAHSMGQATWALGRFIEIAAIGEVFHVIVDTATKLTGTYRKMIDVGETFGGSMFQMAQMAGESGLSLEQFTEAVTKHSTVSAVLISHQEGTSNAFVQLQKSIRDNLKAHSYYGMTLSQLNDTALDYMDVLARTGALERMDTNQQSMAVQGMITSATGFAAAAGKSRDEILKSATDIMREPMFVNWKAMFQPKVQGALDQLVLGLTSIGGKEFGQGFSHIMSDMLGAQNVNNPLVKAFMNSGMLGNLNMYAPLQQEAMAGNAPGVETITTMRRDLLAFRANGGRAQLQNLATWDPESANLLAQHYNQLEALVGTEAATERTIARFNKALEDSKDPVTRGALEFESNFHEITGAIQNSFYQGIVKHLMGSVGDADHAVDNVDKMMDKLSETLAPLGDVFGNIVGLLLDALPTIAKILKAVVDQFLAVRDTLAVFLGKGWGTVATAGAGYGLFKLIQSLTGAGGLRARTVNLYAETVVPGGIGGGGGIGGAVAGQGVLPLTGGSATTAAKGGIRGWLKQNMKFQGFGTALIGMIAGEATAQILDEKYIDPLDMNSTAKTAIETTIGLASSVIGGFAANFATTLLSSLATAFVGTVSASFAGLGVAAIAAAIAGAVAAYFAGKKIGTAADLGYRASAQPFSTDDYGTPTQYYNPELNQTIDAFEMDKRIKRYNEESQESNDQLSDRLKTTNLNLDKDQKITNPTQQTLDEIKDLLAEKMEITNILLHRGNKIAQDAASDADKQQNNPNNSK